MKLIKHFDFTKETQLDDSFWTVIVRDKNANNELQRYVDSRDNLFFDQGMHLRATYDGDHVYSTKIVSKDKFFMKYGRLDFIAKVPSGIGTWPAIWMMPQFSKYGHWPRSGEIDIMEHVGRDRNNLFYCLHTEEYNHKGVEKYKITHQKEGIVDRYHKYSLLWEEGKITYLLDDKEIITYEKGMDGLDDSPKGWPFDEEFYLIINLAIGGKFGGEVDFDSLPQTFSVQDIKIYI